MKTKVFMNKNWKNVTAFFMMLALTGLSITNGWAQTPVRIDVSTLRETPNNSATPAQSQWTYDSDRKLLWLKTKNGTYTLTGTNANIRVSVDVAISLTLDNVNLATTESGSNFNITDTCLITLIGTNTVSNSVSAGFETFKKCTVTSNTNGSLTVTTDMNYSFYIRADISITGNATVSVISNVTGSHSCVWIDGNSTFHIGANASFNATGIASGLYLTGLTTLNCEGSAVIKATGTTSGCSGIIGRVLAITGNGTVSIEGGYDGIGHNNQGNWVVEDCNVTISGKGNRAIAESSTTPIQMNDAAKLTLKSAAGETVKFEKLNPASSLAWRLTNATTADPLTNALINVTVAAGQTATVERGAAPVTIDVGIFGASNLSNAARPAEPQWDYSAEAKCLNLRTANGDYTLTGYNADLAVVTWEEDMKITLNNLNIANDGNFNNVFGFKKTCLITLIGTNSLTSNQYICFSNDGNCTITSDTNGSLTATSHNHRCFNITQPLSITGNATVSVISNHPNGEAALLAYNNAAIHVGANASLNLTGIHSGLSPWINTTLHCDGSVVIKSTGVYGVGISSQGQTLTITGNGTVSVEGEYAGICGTESSLVVEDCNVTISGKTYKAIYLPSYVSDAPKNIKMNDAARLTLKSFAGETHTFEKSNAASTRNWRLTGAATPDPLSGAAIRVTVEAGQTATVERKEPPLPVRIDISTLSAHSNGDRPAESQWAYSDGKWLWLLSTEGNYTLTGTNNELMVYTQGKNISLTLDNVRITTNREDAMQIGTSHDDNSTLTLIGENFLESTSRFGLAFPGALNSCPITSSTGGSLTVKGKQTGIWINQPTAKLVISGNASVTAEGGEYEYAIRTSENIVMGDDAKLTIKAGNYGESHYFEKLDAASTRKWCLTNATTNEPATGDMILCYVDGGQTGTVERKLILPATIDISKLGDTGAANFDKPDESRWLYFETNKTLFLMTADGEYILTGANSALQVMQNFSADITFNNVDITAPDNMFMFAYTGQYDCTNSTLTLTGTNKLNGTLMVYGNYIINGSGNLTATGGNGIQLVSFSFNDANLSITESASVTAIGTGGGAIAGSGNAIRMGDGAALTIVSHSGDMLTFTPYGESSRKWYLSGDATTTAESLDDTDIEVTVPAGKTGKVERKAHLPVTIDVSQLDKADDGNKKKPDESQWRYNTQDRELRLTSSGGEYTLKGANKNLAVKVDHDMEMHGATITLDNVEIHGKDEVAFLIYALNTTLTLEGTNLLEGSTALEVRAEGSCIINGNGLLTATGNNSGIVGECNNLYVLDSAAVNAAGRYGTAIVMPGVTLGDNAKVSIFSENETGVAFVKYNEASPRIWQLTNAESDDPVNGAWIHVNVPANTLGTVELQQRKPLKPINIHKLNKENQSNILTPTEPQWRYQADLRTLFLTSREGRYTLEGANDTLTVHVPAEAQDATIILEDAHIKAPKGEPAVIAIPKTTLLVKGDNDLISDDSALTMYPGAEGTIGGNGSLTAEGEYGLKFKGSKFNVIDTVALTVRGKTLIQRSIALRAGEALSGTGIRLGDHSTVTLVNNSANAETHAFEKYDAASTLHWQLTNAATTDPLNGATINVTIASGKTGTVKRATGTNIEKVSKEKEDVRIYPNPADDVVNFTIEAPYQITDLQGRTVLKINSAVKSVNITSLPSGIYFVILSTEGGKSVQKMIKK